MNNITPQALQDAWNAMRHRPAFGHWPQSFEQVIADTVRARLVRLEATGRAIAACHEQQRPRPTWPHTSGRLPSIQPNLFDHKRAAAGDRDD